jgi:hypothetical protein
MSISSRFSPSFKTRIALPVAAELTGGTSWSPLRVALKIAASAGRPSIAVRNKPLRVRAIIVASDPTSAIEKDLEL